MFTKQELSIIGQIIVKADIKGADAVVIGNLLKKIELLIKTPEKKPEE